LVRAAIRGGSGSAGLPMSHNKAIRARAYMVWVPDLVPEIIVPAVHHIPSPGASTAREKDFAGSAQERRDSGTLYDIPQIMVEPLGVLPN
jgi:hypothetical protein